MSPESRLAVATHPRPHARKPSTVAGQGGPVPQCPKASRPFPGQRGFTLLEVMVAVFVVAVAFTSLLTLHGRNIKMTIRDQNMTRATLLARELVSQVEFTVATQGLQGLSSSQGSPEAYPDLRYEIEVNTTDLEEIRVVIVRVIWDEATPNACELIYYVREQAVES